MFSLHGGRKDLKIGLELTKYPTVRRAILYERLRGNKVRCLVCERRCVIPEGGFGFCRTRVNIDGDLYTVVYGNLSAIESRPIEIKPFFHFWPGSTAITFSTWSCNFTCPWCQNWSLSKCAPPIPGNYVPPEKVVEEAIRNGDEGTCVSFNEPTLLFEYSLDVFKLARERGLYNTYVSNGYMTEDALKMLRNTGLDAINIDVKGTKEQVLKYCGADVDKVWRNARLAKEMGLHVEIIVLVVTGVNDDENSIREIIERHLKEVGPYTPIHFNRYYPAYEYHEPPTRIEVLDFAYRLARREGIAYVYVGNVPGHPGEHTYCPNCGELLIKRWHYTIVKYRLTEGKRCPRCGTEIHIVGKYVNKARLLV
ncbi:MAG: AmmeMemoRadiSam system radical SAM enzyme [Thermoprotei archaeon]|nr:MAG: AmmeMemoRadiSam system radical SAM enzyme [Thermoprotei archaeon]